MKKKCIVKDCNNTSDKGLFIGNLCSPCYRMLISGEIKQTQSFLKELKYEVLPNEIVKFINYFCDEVKNTDICRDGEIQEEWIKWRIKQ